MFNTISKQPSFPEHAKKQVASLKRMFKETVFDGEEHAQLSLLVTDCGFPADLEAELLDAIISTGGNPKKSNNKLQDFTAMLNYFSRTFWNRVQAENVTSKTILATLFEDLFVLGLRNPSCPTFGMMTALYNYLTSGQDVITNLSKEQRYAETRIVKEMWKRRVKYEKDIEVRVFVYNIDPEQFMHEHPSIANVYYENCRAVHCPIPTHTMLYLASLYPLRKQKTNPWDNADRELHREHESTSIVPSPHPGQQQQQRISMSPDMSMMMKMFMDMQTNLLARLFPDEHARSCLLYTSPSPRD